MIASNSSPRWRTRTKTSPYSRARRSSTILRTVRAMRRASFTRGLVSLTVSNGASQPSISLRSSGFTGSQISTTLGGASGKAMCGGKPSRSEVTLSAMSLRLNTSSTAPRMALAGAERVLELADDEFQPAFLVRAPEMAQHVREFLGRGVLERIDRLLFIADREHGARHAARARAGGELGGEPADDFPLLVAGVLRLVDQHMIDAEIELVMHPGRVDVGEQRQRLVDQIVVIKQAAALLLLGIARQHLVSDGEKRGAAIAAGDGAAAFEQRADALLLRAQPLDQGRIADRASVTMDLRGVRAGAGAEIYRDRSRRGRSPTSAARLRSARACSRSVLPPCAKTLASAGPFRRRDRSSRQKYSASMSVDAVRRLDAERASTDSAIAASTPPAFVTQRLIASRLPMASRTTSRKV